MSLATAVTLLNQNVDLALSKLLGDVTETSVTLARTAVEVYPGDNIEFKITNYDSEVAYTVSAALGAASLAVAGNTPETLEAKIDYTAPGVDGQETIQINERQITFPVLARVVVKPSLVAPSDGVTGLGTGPTLTSSAFASTPAGYDSHQSTDWQIATDAGFTTVVWSSSADVVNLETISLASGTLSGGTTYYARVRHTGATLGASQWSDTISFTTASVGVVGTEVALVGPNDAAPGDYFGHSVDVSGDGQFMVVGARYDDDGFSASGSVYVFENQGNNSWVQVQKLTAYDPSAHDYYGAAVAISADGNWIVVGATHDDDGLTSTGSIYIYEKQGGVFTFRQKFSGSTTNSYMGASVAISNDGSTIVAGAYGARSAAGEARIYTYNGTSFIHKQTVYASDGWGDGNNGDFFGMSVDVSADGTVVVAGAHRDNSYRGAAYIYTWDGTSYTNEWKLVPPETTSNNSFAYAVALSDNGKYLVAGAHGLGGAFSSQGATFVYEDISGVWTQRAVLWPINATNAYMGREVCISGDGSVVGIGGSTYSGNTGRAAFAKRSGNDWNIISILQSSDPGTNRAFGWAMALDGDGSVLAVTESNGRYSAIDSGNVRIYN